ncbi:uncharacterized protein LOC134227666 isoform X2 [Armigeres subalbatus]|uniref:uncharacterized protein LOC134227666 isoform X2 n=1 Tax=Armigeres subalbatus TaxID=124917 RepID=UPI002ECFD7B3
MNCLLFQLSSFSFFFGQSQAIPVPNHPFGERNVALLGVLTCIGVGAFIGMCVFCKKKKGHFKFENDGNIEEVKNTEYPILKSLNSLDAKKSGAIIPSSPTNLSTDNLLDQTGQYQNESVSSHDLDGIENYHLLQYQNETYAAKSQSARHVRKESVSSQQQQDLPKVTLHGDDNEDSNSNMLLSTSKESLSSASPLPGTKTSYSMEQETASLRNSVGFGDDKPLIDRCSTDLETGGLEEEDDSSPLNISIQPPTRLDDVTISISERGTSFCEETTSAATTGTTKDGGIQEDVTPMDSLEDNSSVHETNSIEEALRALDIAIDGEDESDDSNDESEFVVGYPEDMEKQLDQRNNVEVRNALFDGKNSSSDSGMDEIEISEKITTPDMMMHDLIRDEATKLVDEILLLCQSRIEEIKECEEKESVEAEVPLQDDDFNDFNSGVVLECSTPFLARRTFDAVKNELPLAKQALFCDASEETYVKGDGVEKLEDSTTSDAKPHPEECENAFTTFNKPNVTNADDDDDRDDLVQIYPINKTVSISQINISQNLPNPSDTFIREAGDTTLPEIMVDPMLVVDDAASDKPTATPMNTPIELGCPTTADWDRWLSASASACEAAGGGLNLQGHQPDEDYFSNNTYDEGWFLHAQPGCSRGMYAAHECGDGNETYEVPEDDNLDSTYDLLRKQLAEMLPHAQGVKEATECYPDNDTSPNHYGIQYGDLDEASNAPSTSSAKDNEMIINYKRTLSPIMEESEDESFYNKTSYYKEASHYVESTSTGCMESLTAMGVNKTLMASNDTLFNFEDVLDEILSPRVPSQSHTPTNRDREIPDYFLRSPRHESSSTAATVTTTTESGSMTGSESSTQPPKSLEFAPPWPRDSSLSSPGDPTRVDFSQDSTFTLDEKTCISLSKPTNEEDERISEISEPILVSSSSGLLKQPQDDNNSLMDEEIISIEDDSFNEILEKEKPLENEQYNHFLDLHSTEAVSVLTGLEPPEPDENFDPASATVLVGGSTGQKDAVLLQNKLNLENTYSNRGIDEQVVGIESIDRFLLKSRNVSLPEDKSTNPLVNGHITSGKLSSRSDSKNICINYDN